MEDKHRLVRELRMAARLAASALPPKPQRPPPQPLEEETYPIEKIHSPSLKVTVVSQLDKFEQSEKTKQVHIHHHHHHHHYVASDVPIVEKNLLLETNIPNETEPKQFISPSTVNKSYSETKPRRGSRGGLSLVIDQVAKDQVTKSPPSERKVALTDDEIEGFEGRGPRSDSQALILMAQTMAPNEDDDEEEGHVEHNREEMLIDMLECADAVESQNQNSVLVSFGQALGENLKPIALAQNSKLPRFASYRETQPSRAPPKVAADPVSSQRARASSDGEIMAGQQKTAVSKSGMLMKLPRQNRWFSTPTHWKARHFQLNGSVLVYFASAGDKAPKGLMDLQTIEIETNPGKLPQGPTTHSMLVYCRGKRKDGWHLCAESFQDILAWYKAIINNAVYLCYNHAPSLPPRNLSKKNIKSSLPQNSITKLKPTDFYPLYENEATHYDILGVTPNALQKEIRKNFYRLAQSFHPDKNPNADPHEFARLNQAYSILFDEQLREKYDAGENLKEVLRRGFDCTMFVPSELDSKVPSKFTSIDITLFSDGTVENLFWQPSDQDDFHPLQPQASHSQQMRFIDRILFGYNEGNVTKCLTQNKRIMVLQGSKIPSGSLIIMLDSGEACKRIIDGMRIVRCETSVLFAQRLEKMVEQGCD